MGLRRGRGGAMFTGRGPLGAQAFDQTGQALDFAIARFEPIGQHPQMVRQLTNPALQPFKMRQAGVGLGRQGKEGGDVINLALADQQMGLLLIQRRANRRQPGVILRRNTASAIDPRRLPGRIKINMKSAFGVLEAGHPAPLQPPAQGIGRQPEAFGRLAKGKRHPFLFYIRYFFVQPSVPGMIVETIANV